MTLKSDVSDENMKLNEFFSFMHLLLIKIQVKKEKMKRSRM